MMRQGSYDSQRKNGGSLHVRVSDAVDTLTDLLPRLEAEVPAKKKNPYGGHGSGQGGHPPLTSWNSQAAMLILDIHAGVRELETNLRYAVTGVVRSRGGSDGNTARALASLIAMCAAADYAAVVIVCRKLESWAWRARMILGDVEPFARLPRLPGESEPRCPFGDPPHPGTLRVRHATGLVICLHPGCKDSEGNRPQGRIEIGSFSGEPLIAWASGETGVAA